MKCMAYKQSAQSRLADDYATFGIKLCAVALNNLYGFGPKRLDALQTKINRILDKEFIQGAMRYSKDYQQNFELAIQRLDDRIQQIYEGN